MHLNGIDATLHDVLMLVGRGVFSQASSIDEGLLCADARAYEWTITPGPHTGLVEVVYAHQALPIPLDLAIEFRRLRISLNIDLLLTSWFTLADLDCLMLWEVDVTEQAYPALKQQATNYTAMSCLIQRLARMSQPDLNVWLGLQRYLLGGISTDRLRPSLRLTRSDSDRDDALAYAMTALYPVSTPSSPTQSMKHLDKMTMEEIEQYLDEHLTLGNEGEG